MRILLACREDSLFPPIREKLREEGFEVRSAEGVYRAIADFARQPTDVVVVDLDPLEASELHFVRILRELSRGVFILGFFSQSHRRKAAEALRLGADACLLQPSYAGEAIWILKRWAERTSWQRSEGDSYRDHLASLARLAKGAAHEINNPLTTLSGWLQLMESEEDRPGEERKRLASMREEADRIAKVVERLLAFSQAPPEQRAPVDMNELVGELVEGLRGRGEGLGLDVSLDADGAVVWANEAQLRNACGILLDDATAALNGQGVVRVQTRLSEGGMFELRVRDNGRRIVCPRPDQVFEPYAVVPRLGEQMSLAYPAAYGILRAHGGELTVTSDEENGTEFLARLPLVSTIP